MPTKTHRDGKHKTALARARVAVVAGGVSSERDISLKSGQAVQRALAKVGFPVKLIDLTSKDITALTDGSFDVAFLTLHGTFGEDGELQRTLDGLNVPYCGSRAEASHNAMDKLVSKILFLKNGIPTAPYHDVTLDCSLIDINRIQRRLGLPLVVKPAAEGSSVGVSKVNTAAQMLPAIERALKFGRRAMVERFIPGREIVVAILDEKPLPLIEIHSPDEIFSYSAKYHDPNTVYDLNPAIEPDKYAEIQQIGLEAHKALGCRHFSRVDLIYGANGQAYVLEVNTLPGLSERSLLPKAAMVAGISFPRLCEKIVNMTLEDWNA